jgi:4-diphosphocytidyl-2-C-methyl-D-erythritol kinase
LKRDSRKVTIRGFSTHGQRALAPAGNDLQPLVARLYPQVASHLGWLSAHGEALMTGSGACVFAAFEHEAEARGVLAQLPMGMQGFVAQGLMHHPLRGICS